MLNDIQGAFNFLFHDWLIDKHNYYKFPKELVKCIASFNSARKIHMVFDSEVETPVPFDSGLPQGSPLSPILLVTCSSVLDALQAAESMAYIDDEVGRVGATTQKAAARALQRH